LFINGLWNQDHHDYVNVCINPDNFDYGQRTYFKIVIYCKSLTSLNSLPNFIALQFNKYYCDRRYFHFFSEIFSFNIFELGPMSLKFFNRLN
jgi:hypothetical protein